MSTLWLKDQGSDSSVFVAVCFGVFGMQALGAVLWARIFGSGYVGGRTWIASLDVINEILGPIHEHRALRHLNSITRCGL